jgi:hypothetical protein
METNRTTSRRALALIQIWASESTASSFARCKVSLSRLTPISRRHRVTLTERAGKVLLPWGQSLRVLWSPVRTSILQVAGHVKHFSFPGGFTACGQRAYHPPLRKQGLESPISVR